LQLFGKYELLAKLGEGGMGAVYIGRQSGPSGFSRLVVIKCIHTRSLSLADARETLLHEARLTARLVHPNIIQIHDLGEQNGVPYLVMEHVHGQTLSRVISESHRQSRWVPLHHCLRVAVDLCRGLHFAHTFVDEHGRSHTLVHRDVKPSNVLISFSGQVKLIDFGIAKSQVMPSHTKTSEIKGSMFYMSPEQVLGRPIDHRSDIFSLGVVLYNTLTGRQPFLRESSYLSYEAIVKDPVPPPSTRRPGLPERVDDILERCLAKDPDWRWPSAAELQQELQGAREVLLDGSEPEDLAAYMEEVFPGQREFRISKLEALARTKTATDLPFVTASDLQPDAATVSDQLSERRRPTIPDTATEEETGGDGGSADTADAADADDRRPTAPFLGQATEPDSTLQPRPPAGKLLAVVDDVAPRTEKPARNRFPTLLAAAVVGLLAVVVVGLLLLLPGPEDTQPAQPAARDLAVAPVDAAAPDRAMPDHAMPDHAMPDHAVSDHTAPDRRRRRVHGLRSTRAKPDAAPKRALGTIEIRTHPAASIRLGDQGGQGRAALPVRGERGRVRVGGVFEVDLDYAVEPDGLVVTVRSRPWSIVYPEGLRPGRTPRRGVRIGGAQRRLELRHPDGKEMTIMIRYRGAR
jgi:serine/threonine-protein kinase